MLVLEEADEAGLRVEAPGEPGLMDDVDVVLETVRDTDVPHRYCQKISVGSDKPVRHDRDLVPCLLLRTLRYPAGHDLHLGGGLKFVEREEVFFP
jgi:hypothetical protein